MLSSGRHLRFTPAEIERHESTIGLDLSDAHSVEQFARAMECWALVMAEVRPDLVRKLEQMLRDRIAQEQGGAEAPSDVPAAPITSA